MPLVAEKIGSEIRAPEGVFFCNAYYAVTGTRYVLLDPVAVRSTVLRGGRDARPL